MAKCKTCEKTIRIPNGWSIGSAVRRHYWSKHPEVMLQSKADNSAESALPAPRRKRRSA